MDTHKMIPVIVVVLGLIFICICFLIIIAFVLQQKRLATCPFCGTKVKFIKKYSTTHHRSFFRYECGCKIGSWKQTLSKSQEQWNSNRLVSSEDHPKYKDEFPDFADLTY